MLLIQADVFIQVEAAHFFPGQRGGRCQKFQRIELGSPGCKNNAKLVVKGGQPPHLLSDGQGGRLAGSSLAGVDLQLHLSCGQ